MNIHYIHLIQCTYYGTFVSNVLSTSPYTMNVRLPYPVHVSFDTLILMISTFLFSYKYEFSFDVQYTITQKHDSEILEIKLSHLATISSVHLLSFL